MELDAIKKLIKKYAPYHADMVRQSEVAERYYRNKNDILYDDHKDKETESPLRNADNRVPRNFHGLLVNQKAAYVLTAPPLFDIGSTAANKRITEVLGDEFPKTCMELCINASNSAVAWLHYWVNQDEQFEYGIVSSKEIIPVWSKSLKRKLIGILRVYTDLDDDGESFIVYEYWSDTECQAFRRKSDTDLDDLQPYSMFDVFNADTQSSDISDTYPHSSGRIPFIPFFNNNIHEGDLGNVKKLIDTYDKVYSGFVNDLEDIQEIIFILSGYGGADLKEFVQDLKKYKAIKVDPDDGSGVSSLTINIPVEAREKLLTITRRAIFEQGQGVDPDPQSFGNASGVALKYLYSLLELKAGLMETEFKLAFGEFVRAICRHLGIECKSIVQTWTRTAITNDTELADIAQKSAGVISKKTILQRHPWVEDADKEMEEIKKEEELPEDEDMIRQHREGLGGKKKQVSTDAEE